MYKLVQFIRHRVPFIWNFIEFLNTSAFKLRYGRKLKSLQNLLSGFDDDTTSYQLAEDKDAPKLVEFFKQQPQSAFEFFKPHDFDINTILKLVRNPAFIMILAKVDSKIIGYSFLRCFANGKSFRGKIVDIDYRGKGVAKQFGLQTTEIASRLGIGLYGTISKSNVSSMASSKSSNEIKIIEELPDDYILIQYLPKH